MTLRMLCTVERLISLGSSDDFERYSKMGLQIAPNDTYFLAKRGEALAQKQMKLPWSEKDYSYIDFYRKAYENETQPSEKSRSLYTLQESEARRDFYAGSIRQINHLIQFDPKPNLELNEPRCEIYKISVSFRAESKSSWIL